MKKRKLLFLFPLAALVLSGCSFEEAFETAKSFMNDKIVEPVKDLIPGAKKEEKEEKEEKDEKPSESEDQEGQGQEGEGQEGQGGEGGEGEGGEGGGQEEPPVVEKELVSILVSGEFKTEYDLNEEFDQSGIVVTAVYDDESTEDISSQAEFSGFDSSSEATVTITVSFEGKTASFDVNVKARSFEFKEAKEMFAGIESIGEVDIPNYPGEDLDASLFDADLENNDLMYYVKNTTHADMDAYAELLTNAGWELETDSWGDYSGTFGETLASVYLGDYLEYSSKSIHVEFYVGLEKVSSVSFASIEEYFASEDIEVEIPDYEGDDITYQTSESGLMFLIDNSSHEQMDAFADAMKDAGWELETNSWGDYGGYFGETDAYVSIEDWIDYYPYYGILITFELKSSEGVAFPSDEILEDLTAAGVTDLIPPYSGVSTYSSYYSGTDGRQLVIQPTIGESAGISLYQDDLLGASYTSVGPDQYGDLHFESPNHQLDVCAWAGSDIGYSGYVFIDIEILSTDPVDPPAEGMTPEEFMTDFAEWLDGVPEENDGDFSLLSIYDANEVSPTEIAAYISDVMEYFFDEFELAVEWFEYQGMHSASYMNAAYTCVEFYVDNETLFVDGDGNLCEETDEGATAFQATIVVTEAYVPVI